MSVQHERPNGLNEGLPGCPRAFVMARIPLVTERRRGNMTRLLQEVDCDDYWSKDRYVQIVRLLDRMYVFGVAQTDIAKVMDVSNNLVTRLKVPPRTPRGRATKMWTAKPNP